MYEEFWASLSSQGRDWAQQALLSGKLRIIDKEEVATQTESLEAEKLYRSDDPHVLALAQISGARLLYSNDADLQQDFKNKCFLNNPRGKIYSTLESKAFGNSHKRLLRKRDLCRIE